MFDRSGASPKNRIAARKRLLKTSRRRCGLERLESRQLLAASPFQNPENRFDVNGDGGVDQFDALIVINEIQARAVSAADGSLPSNPALPVARFFDVNCDNFVTVDDANDVLDAIGIPLLLDYGDAPTAAQSGLPASYPTSLADDGARHFTGPLFLGASVDFESEGSASADAMGDDNSTSDDEDGVRLLTKITAGGATIQSVDAEVTASAAGVLDAWIDFNRDGDWDDSDERVFDGTNISAGTNQISFNAPASLTEGGVFARFRLTSTGIDSPKGNASDGEVEDYVFQVEQESSGSDPEVTILPQTTLTIEGGEVLVKSGDNELLRQSATSITSLRLIGTTNDETLTLDLTNAQLSGLPSFAMEGGQGNDSLRAQGELSELNLTTASNVSASNFAVIDLSAENPTTVILDAAGVSRLSPAARVVTIIGNMEPNNGDAIELQNPADWRMSDPEFEEGSFFLTATHQTTGEVVRADFLRDFHNFVDASDINNDGNVTASDALRIINELGRRSFSNQDGELFDASVLDPFPNAYVDQNADGSVTALDALRVVNELARRLIGSGAEEIVDVVLTDPRSPTVTQSSALEATIDALASTQVDSTRKIAIFDSVVRGNSRAISRTLPGVAADSSRTSSTIEGSEVFGNSRVIGEILRVAR